MDRRGALIGLFAGSIIVACSGSSSSPGTNSDVDASTTTVDAGAVSTDASTSHDAGLAPADAKADVDKSATCAATFGMSLTPKFGRFDGTVTAVVPPDDQACALPNKTHLVIQGKMNGEIYRMVVDVLSNQGSPDVSLYEIDAPLAGGMPWAEGWHDTATLDYATTLSVHNTSFVPVKEAALVTKITSEINLGDHVSIFATSGSTEPHSAHLIHRNGTNADGAIVVRPESANAHYILLAFAEQIF